MRSERSEGRYEVTSKLPHGWAGDSSQYPEEMKRLTSEAVQHVLAMRDRYTTSLLAEANTELRNDE